MHTQPSVLGGLEWPSPSVILMSKNGKLSFDVGDDHVEFNLFRASKFPSISDECHMIDVVIVWCKKPFLTMNLMTLLSIVY